MMMILTAIVFSLIPPTGRIFPVRDNSPVIATFCRTDRLVARDNNAVTIVQPALGPSLGVAPWNQNKKWNQWLLHWHLPYNYKLSDNINDNLKTLQERQKPNRQIIKTFGRLTPSQLFHESMDLQYILNAYLRNMHVQMRVEQEAVLGLLGHEEGFGKGWCNLSAFLHHVAKLPCRRTRSNA